MAKTTKTAARPAKNTTAAAKATKTPKAKPATQERDAAAPVAAEPETPTEAEAEAPKPAAKPLCDAFGTRIGSKQAAINAALAKEPQTMKEIVAKAGIADRTFYNHLKRLAAAGMVVYEEGKYHLP